MQHNKKSYMDRRIIKIATILLITVTATLTTKTMGSDLIVTLKSGALIQGKLVGRSDGFATMETRYGEISLPVTAVESQSWNKLQTVKISPRRGKFIPEPETPPTRSMIGKAWYKKPNNETNKAGVAPKQKPNQTEQKNNQITTTNNNQTLQQPKPTEKIDPNTPMPINKANQAQTQK